MKKMKASSFLGLCLLIVSLCQGQNFGYKSQVEKPAVSGFFGITITPEMSSYLDINYRDLRIVDEKGQWVPHIIRYIEENNLKSDLRNLTIEEQKHENQRTTLLIANPDKSLLSNFTLQVKNSSVDRKISLSGSDDKKNWFIIFDSLVLSSKESNTADEYLRELNFPSTKYSYFKLTIRNDRKDPLNIISIKTRTPTTENLSRLSFLNPAPLVRKSDSAKFSFIEIINFKPFQIDEIKFWISRPAFYERKAELFLLKNKDVKHEVPVSNFVLSSDAINSVSFQITKAETLFVKIANLDNPPLTIDSIRTLQRQKIIIAYLEKGKNYSLLMQSAEADFPQYDLKKFDNAIPQSLPNLNIGEIRKVDIKNKDNASKGDRQWWIWPVIIVVILVLGFLVRSLTKDINKV